MRLAYYVVSTLAASVVTFPVQQNRNLDPSNFGGQYYDGALRYPHSNTLNPLPPEAQYRVAIRPGYNGGGEQWGPGYNGGGEQWSRSGYNGRTARVGRNVHYATLSHTAYRSKLKKPMNLIAVTATARKAPHGRLATTGTYVTSAAEEKR
jgi:hypothetical protein